MSNTPGISPLTPDIEDVRHSDEDGFEDLDQPADEEDETEEDAEVERRPDR